MKGHSRKIVPLQRGYEGADVTFAVTENHRVLHIFNVQQAAKRFALALWRRPGQVLGNSVGRACRRCHFNNLGIGDELVAELLDVVRQGGREEQGLAKWRQQADNPLYIRNEAHIEHPVGFVDNEDFHICQQHLAALEMIKQAAGRGNQHIDTLVEGGILVGKAHTADQQRHGQLVVGAEFLEGVGDLSRQFTRWCQDQRAWQARFGAAGCQYLDHRQGE